MSEQNVEQDDLNKIEVLFLPETVDKGDLKNPHIIIEGKQFD